MSFISALISMIAVIIIYALLVKIFTALFRMTGISKDKSRFQVISLLTSSGYTTEESEIIVSDKTRRKIAISAMITGYFFSVIIVSLLVNLFTAIDYSEFEDEIIIIFAAIGGLLLIFLIFSIPFVRRGTDKIIEKITRLIYKRHTKGNYISVIDSYGKFIVANVYLRNIPKGLEGVSVYKSDLRKKYDINLLMFTRKDKTHSINKDTILVNGDTVLCFGKAKSIQEAFLENIEIKIVEKDDDVNDIDIIESFPNGVLAEVNCVEVPPTLVGKTIYEAKFKDYYNINIVMISRKGDTVEIHKDTTIEHGDKIILFGKYENITLAFRHIDNSDNK